MAEYSRLASGQVVSTGGSTNVILPFIPDFIEISNKTRLAATNSGVSRAWWETDMGQGAAFVVTTTNASQDQTTFIDALGGTGSTTGATAGTGFTTIQAGLSLQYGPVYQHTGSTDFAINKANPAQITCTTAHGLVSGNVVVFQNLYETTTTGMPQICGIPFVVTVTGADVFTIPWNTNQSDYTAVDTSTSTGNVGSWKQVLYPSLYTPGKAVISAITTGATTTVVTTAPHNFVVGQEVAFRIPTLWGTTQLNSLPDLIIPGSPIYGYVTSVTNSTTVVVNINSSGYTAFNTNVPISSLHGLSFPQIVAVGDNNSGSNQFGYNSPTVFNGTGTSAVSTINGPAIAGAFINATYQGFIIGSAIAGTAADVIYWRAYKHDLNT
ncbi:MAG TPA: hypothetical protein VGF75_07050 [Candidatus Saccharimonadales bacterium]|jgi:hypothetical protein